MMGMPSLSISLFSGTKCYKQLFLATKCTICPGISHFSKEPVPFRKQFLEIKIWILGLLFAVGVLLLPGLLSRQR